VLGTALVAHSAERFVLNFILVGCFSFPTAIGLFLSFALTMQLEKVSSQDAGS